jgi:hypothetical protein
MRFKTLLLAIVLLAMNAASADAIRQTKSDHYDAFRQLEVDLPTPNVYRTASGAPGTQYWQQRADHQIKVILNEDNRSISASETIRYSNNSPDTLRYIWIQLDQNRFADGSIARLTETAAAGENNEDVLSYGTLAAAQRHADVEHGFKIESVTDSRGRDLKHTIVDTMMRIDLPQALRTGQNTTFSIAWSFNIIEESVAVAATIIFLKATPIYISSHSGTPNSLHTPIMVAGSISNSWAEENSHRSLATTKLRSRFRLITSFLQPASCKTRALC